jgi:zinc protease
MLRRYSLQRLAPIAAAVLLCGGLVGAAGAQSQVAWPQASAELPGDPDTVLGVLPNGLRYAIRKNNTPPGQVVLRLQILAGAMHERPDQLGYAHLVEHMAFRGSTHLGDGEYARRLEALGAAFGADINAFTTSSTTTYRIDLPRAAQANLDTGLLLLREVASELLLKPEQLEAERGVVLAEERSSASVGRRAGMAANVFIYEGHPYARAVIGNRDSIRQAKAAELRAFYEAYYRPERAILVVAGDVDPATIEAQIRATFADWRGRGSAGADPSPLSAPKGGQQIFLYNEPGLAPDIRMVWREAPPAGPVTREREIARIRETIAMGIISNRLAEASQAPGSPFQRSNAGAQQIPGVSSELFVEVTALSNWKTGMDRLLNQVRNLTEADVGQDEIDRVVAQRRLVFADGEARSRTRGNGEIVNALLGDLAAGRVIQSPAQRRALFEAAAASLTPADIAAIFKEKLGHEARIVVTSPAPIPGGEESVRAVIAAAAAAPLRPIVRAQAKEWPFANFGPAGKLVERRDAEGGVALVRFENGVRLTVKRTAFRGDEILVNVRFGEGLMGWSSSRAEPERALWLPLLSQGGLEGITAQERNLFLAGKRVSLAANVTDDAFVLTGVTRGQDLDVQMQLLAADLTAPAWRPDGFEQMRRLQVGQLLSPGSPQAVFRRREGALWRSGDARWAQPSPMQVSATSYERARAFGQAIVAKGSIEVTVVGDVTPERAIESVASTFGALPPREPTQIAPEMRQVKFPEGTVTPVTMFHAGREDQGLAVIAWPTTDFWTDPKGAAAVDVLREVLRQRLLSQLRATLGQTYSPQVTAQASMTLPGYGVMAARIEAPPEVLASVFEAIDRIAADLAAHELTREEFALAANPYAETVSRDMQNNSYWLTWLSGAQGDPRRLAAAVGAAERARSVTPADVHKAARTWLKKDRTWRAQIIPDPADAPVRTEPDTVAATPAQ